MEETKTTYHCLNCRRAETEIPLVSLRYGGHAAWICTLCLPTLIHHPEELVGKIAGADKFPSAAPAE